jgi:hypothetical protein
MQNANLLLVEQKVQECDATMLNSSTLPWFVSARTIRLNLCNNKIEESIREDGSWGHEPRRRLRRYSLMQSANLMLTEIKVQECDATMLIVVLKFVPKRKAAL